MTISKVPVKAFEERQAMFDYDRTKSPGLEEVGSEQRDGVTVRDVQFDSLSDGKIKAYVVVPAEKGRFPGVLFVHPGPGDRTNFLDDAVRLAQQNIVSLLVEAPWAQAQEWGSTMGEPEHDKAEFTRIGKDLRRALDVLASLPEVDKQRLGYVGHSFGGSFGGILAGLETRVKAFVLLAGVGRFADIAALNIPTLKGEVFEHYSQVLDPIEPIHYIGQAEAASFFFQFGEDDHAFGREKFEHYAQAAPDPKTVKWYQADHYSVNQAGQADRLEWLREQLAK